MASKKRTKKTKARAPRKASKAPAKRRATKRAKAAPKKAVEPAAPRERDPRLPPAGTLITRPYKGTDYEMEVLEHGFRWNGDEYRSLSALASAITGHKSINGYLWFRLTEPRSAKAKTAPNKETAAD